MDSEQRKVQRPLCIVAPGKQPNGDLNPIVVTVGADGEGTFEKHARERAAGQFKWATREAIGGCSKVDQKKPTIARAEKLMVVKRASQAARTNAGAAAIVQYLATHDMNALLFPHFLGTPVPGDRTAIAAWQTPTSFTMTGGMASGDTYVKC